MSSRRGLTEPVISAVADALGARDGYVLKDLFDYDHAPFPNGRSFEVLQVGSCDKIAAEIQRRVTALGYGPVPERRGLLLNGEPWKGNDPQADDALPHLAYTILGPGEQLQGLTIPRGTAGIRISISRGRILKEGDSPEAKHLNAATTQRMADHGLRVRPVPAWHRYWGWWWLRRTVKAVLVARGHMLGAYRGRVVEVRQVGGEASAGPCNLSVLTLRRGSRDEVLRRLTAALVRRGYQASAQGDGSGMPRFTTTRAGQMEVHAVVFEAGEIIDAKGRAVPADRTGVGLTLTRRGKRTGTRTSVLPFMNAPSAADG
ncbi:hypothetical protein [Streptomyces sp. NPDC020917]|uniref:hypothetical protein n=1 Tax=Streptomyces sp. NPDC020917 TaxID=3365102 RepID=UPI00379FB868